MPAATGIAVSATAVSGRTAGTTLHSRATVGSTTAANIDANANQRSCSRSTPLDRRRRWTRGTIATTNEPRNSGMPIPRSRSIGAPSTAKGLRPPMNWSPRSGSMAHPGNATAAPTMLAQATTCQPRRVRWPSGNHRKSNTPAGPVAIQLDSANHSPKGPPGQPCSAARSPHPCARSVAAPSKKPETMNSQPMRCPGWRETIRAPTATCVTAWTAYSEVSHAGSKPHDNTTAATSISSAAVRSAAGRARRPRRFTRSILPVAAPTRNRAGSHS